MLNNWPILKGEWALKLCLTALSIYTCLLPFQPMFPPITAGIVAFWLVYVLSFTRNRWRLLWGTPFTRLWVIYYLILVLGFIYTSNAAEAGRDIVLKISLILWPLGFISWPEPILKYRNTILALFAWTTVASSVTIILAGTYFWANANVPSEKLFAFLNIWDTLPNHYIALYASFSILVFLHLILQKSIKWLWAVLGIAVLLVFIGLISVRIQLVALPISALVFLIFHPTKGTLKKKLSLYTLLGLVVVGGLAVMIPTSRNRILETVDEARSFKGMVNLKQTNHRVFLWKYGEQVVEEHFWVGTGTGAADDALNEKLKDCDAIFWNGHRNYFLHENRYNYHNAYLQQFATHGVFGFLILMLIFVAPFAILKRKIGGLQAAFLTLCAIAFITESMLERQAGVLFFGFFYSLLFVPSARKSGK